MRISLAEFCKERAVACILAQYGGDDPRDTIHGARV